METLNQTLIKQAHRETGKPCVDGGPLYLSVKN